MIQIHVGAFCHLGHSFNNPVGPAPGQIRNGYLTRASVLFSKRKLRPSPCYAMCPLAGVSRRRRGPGIWPWGGSFLWDDPAVVRTPQGPWGYCVFHLETAVALASFFFAITRYFLMLGVFVGLFGGRGVGHFFGGVFLAK